MQSGQASPSVQLFSKMPLPGPDDARGIALAVRIWRKGQGSTAIANWESGFISTSSSYPKSKRFHPGLYKKLDKVLLNNDR